MCDTPDDVSDVWTEERRRARREHRCYACDETIRVGDVHRYTSSLYDGTWDSWRHCLRCAAMIEALHDRNPGIAVALDLNCGEIWDDAPPEIAALAFLTREEIQALGKDGGL